MGGKKPGFNKMASSLPFAPLALSLCLLVLLPTLGFCKPQDKIFMHHGGPMLNGNINLYLFWYGKFAPVELESVRGFIESLNAPTEKKMKPSVGTWWNMVESYQKALVKKQKFSPRIGVRVVGQGFDQQYQQGKVITQDYVNKLHKESSMPNVKNTIFVLITAKDVTLHGSCLDRCALHGNFDSPGKELFIVVNNPEKECPQKCTWPFVKHYTVKSSVALRPPSGNIGADSLVMHLAGALAATVTNPYRDGWYQGPFFKQTEAAVFCAEMFGTGARPGYPGKTQIDKFTGGAFNAHGVRGKKFLLPALWNPVKKQCWTLM